MYPSIPWSNVGTWLCLSGMLQRGSDYLQVLNN
jgi:hypothetical protein